MQSLLILGRQPAIGRAELESLYGDTAFTPVGETAMLSSLSTTDIAFERLGGSIKLGTVLETLPTLDWHSLQEALVRLGQQEAATIGEGKIQLGLSAYDLRLSTRQLTAAGLELKKALRSVGKSVRLVQNQEPHLNSAQILHNHLTGERGVELVAVRHGNHIIVARTVAEQDIVAYTERDRGRPKRDARVGMLPPKLAQNIINLAVGQTPPSPDFTVLDPFCGTGVVLQEALMMGFSTDGSDLEPRMTEHSSTNISWLRQNHPDLEGFLSLDTSDATTHRWENKINAVACETYLGRPLTALPSNEKLREIVGTCNTIIEKFLRNIGGQIAPGTRLCLAVPAWQHPNGRFTHLPLLDHLGVLGYNRIDFKYARAPELIYHRPDQTVARELLVLTKS